MLSLVILASWLSAQAQHSLSDDVRLPYLVELSKGNKRLCFFGARHSADPADEMFLELEKRFVGLNPRLVLVEGGVGWPSYSTRDSTIRLTGDPGFVLYLSRMRGIPAQSIEPEMAEEFGYLVTKHDSSDVLLMYFLRQAEQIRRTPGLTDSAYWKSMNGYMKSTFNRQLKIRLTIGNMLTKYEAFFGERLAWRTFDPSVIWPTYNKTILNEISRLSSDFRDLHTVRVIASVLQEYDRVFVCMGGSHLVAIESRIRQLMR